MRVAVLRMVNQKMYRSFLEYMVAASLMRDLIVMMRCFRLGLLDLGAGKDKY